MMKICSFAPPFKPGLHGCLIGSKNGPAMGVTFGGADANNGNNTHI